MLRDLWKYITNLGISELLTPFDQKAIKLMNQVSFVMMIWFAIITVMGLFFFKPLQFFTTASNVILFGGVLLINAYRKTTISKNYFMVFGLGMITFVNIAFPAASFPMVQYITTAIFPILIFKKTRTSLIYLGLNLVCLVFVLYYHGHYPPLTEPGTEGIVPTAYAIVFIVMIVVFLIALFFRYVSEDLERKLVEKNRFLNELIEKMKSMQEQLINSDKMASLGQLTAGIAHEINNPINFVSSNISPLKRDLIELKELCKKYKGLHSSKTLEKDLEAIEAFTREIDPEFLYQEIETLIRGIEEGAGRTRQIVLGLRSFSRLDEDEFKEVDIHEGIESTLMLLRNKIKNRIEIKKNFGSVPPVECIPGKLNQVLMNILNNASDAIGEKGTITITTKRDKNNLVISIRDDGMGMKESVRRRVFEPFYTTKAIGQGTGLGLSISYGIIERHNGTLEVKSEPGKGSEFIITLPLKQPDKADKRGKKGF
jgi:signal transduction histidine kinase